MRRALSVEFDGQRILPIAYQFATCSFNAAVLDAVCWRGSHLDECAGTFVPDDVEHMSIGRGFHIDTDDSAQDFLPQPEPSPWSRNLREVW